MSWQALSQLDAGSDAVVDVEFYRMAGDVDYMLRVAIPDVQSYDLFHKKLIHAVALWNITSRFATERSRGLGLRYVL